jgi:hypothetical protein
MKRKAGQWRLRPLRLRARGYAQPLDLSRKVGSQATNSKAIRANDAGDRATAPEQIVIKPFERR